MTKSLFPSVAGEKLSLQVEGKYGVLSLKNKTVPKPSQACYPLREALTGTINGVWGGKGTGFKVTQFLLEFY